MIIIYLLLILVLLTVVFSSASLAPFVPVRTKDLSRINSLSSIKPGETFVDMGSGNGRVTQYIAKNNPEANVVGVELSFPLYVYSQVKKILAKQKNIKYVFKNLYNYDLKNADVIYLFGTKDTLTKKLKEKILQEMSSEKRVVSYCFGFKDWKPENIDKPGKNELSIYVYKI